MTFLIFIAGYATGVLTIMCLLWLASGAPLEREQK